MARIWDWWKTERRYVMALKVILAALLPLAVCLLTCAMQGKGIGDVYLPGSQWNDELFYFKQVESIVNYGFPQGYYGFNESHALKLSFAAWSPVLVFPWVLWGLVFGWNLLSPVICNILLMTLAVALFVWLVNLRWKQLGVLALLFFLYTPFARYMLSGMPEIICFSMLIVFYGLVIRYVRNKSVACLVWMFILSGLLTLMRPYMLLFLLLPMIFWVARKRWQGVIGSCVVTAVVGTCYVLIKHYLGAEYFAPLFFTDWITAFFERGFFGGIRNFFGTLYWNGKAFLEHLTGGITRGLASGAFFAGYLAMLVLLLWQTVVDWRKLRKNKKDRTTESAGTENGKAEGWDCSLLIAEAHLAFSFIGMLFALLLMYKLTEGSKHLLTFLAAGVFLVSLMETKLFRKFAYMGAVFAYFYIYMAVDPYDYQVPFAEESRVEAVEQWREELSEELVLTGEEVPNYENVVIWTFSDTVDGNSVNTAWQLLYALPKGFGISCCMPDYVLENLPEMKSRYLCVVRGGEIETLCREAGYTVVVANEDAVLYRRF